MAKMKSRTARWDEAVSECRDILDRFPISDLENALQELKSVQEEYQDWLDNLPENLQQSALGEKLEAVCGLEIPDGDVATYTLDDLLQYMEEAEGASWLRKGLDEDIHV